MSKKLIVRLTKLFLWIEAARFQTYPELVCKVDPNRLYRGMHDVARDAISSRDVDGRHLSRDDDTFNLPGWGLTNKDSPVLKGVGLFRKGNKGYVLSEEGRKLADLYRANPEDYAWKIELARILLTREPRTRVIVGLLLKEGAFMQFGKPTWFGGYYREVSIESEGRKYHPFPPRREPTEEIQTLLDRAGKWALGAWADEETVKDVDEIRFASVLGPKVYPYDLGLALRGPFELFLNLGLVRESEGVATWQHERAAEMLPLELLEDFGALQVRSKSLPELLIRLIGDLEADNGFVVASQLREAMLKEGIETPDKEIAELMNQGILGLSAHDFGQARHGEGLFGDPKKQLVKFRIASEYKQNTRDR